MGAKKEKQGELYAKIQGEFIPLSGLAIGPTIRPLRRLTVAEAIEKYLKSCTSQKCADNQITEQNFFLKFQSFLESYNVDGIDQVTSDMILDFQNLLFKDLKGSSVNRRFNTIKHFFNMCAQWECVHKDPCKGIKKKKEEPNPYKNWTEKEFETLIITLDGVWKAITLFLWHSGCRPIEAANLKWTDVDHTKGEITLRCGKNAVISRKFPLTNELSKILHNIPIDGLYVFSNKAKPLNADKIYQYVKRRLLWAKLGHLSPYGLRHSFAERLAKQGISPFFIQKLMGHADISTTMVYVHDDKNNLKDALNKLK